LITLVGTTAGFLAATLPDARSSSQAGPIEPGSARLLTPAPDVLRLSAAGQGPAHAIVYDENETLQRSVQLPADAGERETRLDLAGPAIVLVPRSSAPVRVGLPADTQVRSVPTATTSHELVTAEGPIEETVTVEMAQRPASLALTVDGDVRDLDAHARSSQGTVLRQVNATAAEGQAHLTPANLANGTYRVDLEADHVAGNLTLVALGLTYHERLTTLEAPDAVAEHGTVLARVAPGEAWQVPADEVDQFALVLERGGQAQVRLYSPDHRALRAATVGDDGPGWEWSNETDLPDYQAATVDASRDTYTVYAANVRADTDATVYVVAPDARDPSPGRPAEVRTTTVTVGYPSPSGNANQTARYPGGLVDVHVQDARGAAVDRRITVEGGQGLVLDRYDEAAGEGTAVGGDAVTHERRFGPGPLDVTVRAEAASGSLTLALDHYVPP
jgi:hypothetical protein